MQMNLSFSALFLVGLLFWFPLLISGQDLKSGLKNNSQVLEPSSSSSSQIATFIRFIRIRNHYKQSNPETATLAPPVTEVGSNSTTAAPPVGEPECSRCCPCRGGNSTNMPTGPPPTIKPSSTTPSLPYLPPGCPPLDDFKICATSIFAVDSTCDGLGQECVSSGGICCPRTCAGDFCVRTTPAPPVAEDGCPPIGDVGICLFDELCENNGTACIQQGGKCCSNPCGGKICDNRFTSPNSTTTFKMASSTTSTTLPPVVTMAPPVTTTTKKPVKPPMTAPNNHGIKCPRPRRRGSCIVSPECAGVPFQCEFYGGKCCSNGCGLFCYNPRPPGEHLALPVAYSRAHTYPGQRTVVLVRQPYPRFIVRH